MIIPCRWACSPTRAVLSRSSINWIERKSVWTLPVFVRGSSLEGMPRIAFNQGQILRVSCTGRNADYSLVLTVHCLPPSNHVFPEQKNQQNDRKCGQLRIHPQRITTKCNCARTSIWAIFEAPGLLMSRERSRPPLTIPQTCSPDCSVGHHCGLLSSDLQVKSWGIAG